MCMSAYVAVDGLVFKTGVGRALYSIVKLMLDVVEDVELRLSC